MVLKRRTQWSRVGLVSVTASVLALAVVAGCAPPEESASPVAGGEVVAGHPNPLRDAYFGDLHVHTKYSFDAYIFNVRASPDDAYRYAKGEAIEHPSGATMQLQSGPFDFEAVTDHGMYLGTMFAMDTEGDPLYDTPLAKELRSLGPAEGFARAIAALRGRELVDYDTEPAMRSAWQRVIEAAERHNEPGKFTTFVGYEYTASTEDRGNLHRNVIFRGSDVPELPFTTIDSANPEDLWAWLDARRAEGVEALAIPHNSNGSNGQMFRLETLDGEPLDADYAETRMRNEPLVEVSQVKGTSEVHPMLSPNDEWADFEIFKYRIATTLYSEPKGSYVREAYLNGLKLQEEQGFNPFRFGLIASTDTHNAAGTPEEYNYFSKVGERDGTPQLRGSVPLDEPGPDGKPQYDPGYFQTWGASGLAGVWAEENTRESIYDAFRRKETFATSGPRIRVRFFAGYDYDPALADAVDMIEQAYGGGVPMGGDLTAEGGHAPSFLVWASRDAHSGPLQRLQVIKGWMTGGEAKEQVYDIACSDGLEPDAATHRCPDNGATVDLTNCSFSQGLGASELKTVWSDPAFDPSERAFYYVRVLENPTCRWSTWDAIRAGVAPREGVPATIQERAWSSPIWYAPAVEE